MKKVKILMVLAVLAVIAFAGCTKVIVEEIPAATEEPVVVAEEPAEAPTAAPTEAPEETDTPSSDDSDDDDSDEAAKLVDTILEDAKQGRIINCKIAVQTTMDDVKSEWGDPDSDDFISDAKGSYAEYADRGVVFGYNTGGEIFEVRRVAGDVLEEMTLKDIKNELGDPDHVSHDENQNPIVGYQVSDDYKLVFVMDDADDDSGVDHYNVLWPQGSADLMSGDMGKAW